MAASSVGEPQIFLSYAHIDNEKLDETHKGWVDYFYTVLMHELRQRKGDAFHFWRDNRDIRPNDFFTDRILGAVDTSRLFLAIVSPVYLQRDYCMKELQRFVAAAGAELQLRAQRTLKVVKRRVPRTPGQDNLPYPLNGREGFKFYVLNDEDRRREILFWDDGDGQVDPRYKKLYWDVIRLIADEIERQLRGDNRSPQSDAAGPILYLAAPSFDRREDYWMIRGELERKLGARIVPEDPELPNLEADALKVINAALENAAASVHLLGATSGHTPDGPTRMPLVPLQLERAGTKAKQNSAFRRLIWLPPNVEPADDHQKDVLAGLQSGSRLVASDEFVCEPLERFKSHAIDCIAAANDEPHTASNKHKKRPVVFLLCQQEDEEAALALRKIMYAQGIDVRMPEFEGSSTARQEAFSHHAAKADAALVYLGLALEFWAISTLDQLSDWRDHGRKTPLKPCAVLIGREATGRKQHFANHHADLTINGLHTSHEEVVSQLLESMART